MYVVKDYLNASSVRFDATLAVNKLPSGLFTLLLSDEASMNKVNLKFHSKYFPNVSLLMKAGDGFWKFRLNWLSRRESVEEQAHIKVKYTLKLDKSYKIVPEIVVDASNRIAIHLFREKDVNVSEDSNYEFSTDVSLILHFGSLTCY